MKFTAFQVIYWSFSAKNLMIFILKKITKKYTKHEIQRLSKNKDRKADIGAARRPFKMNLRLICNAFGIL